MWYAARLLCWDEMLPLNAAQGLLQFDSVSEGIGKT